jgi:hypothetical protein
MPPAGVRIEGNLAVLPVGAGPVLSRDCDDSEQFQIQGLTTRPSLNETSPVQRRPDSVPRARALGNTALTIEEIDQLFAM